MAAISSGSTEKTDDQYKAGRVSEDESSRIDQEIKKVILKVTQDSRVAYDIMQKDAGKKKQYEVELDEFAIRKANDFSRAFFNYVSTRAIQQIEKKPDELYILAARIALLSYAPALFDSVAKISSAYIGNIKKDSDKSDKLIANQKAYLIKISSCTLDELKELDLLFKDFTETTSRDSIESHTVRDIVTYLQAIPNENQRSIIKEFEKITALLIGKKEENEYVFVED